MKTDQLAAEAASEIARKFVPIPAPFETRSVELEEITRIIKAAIDKAMAERFSDDVSPEVPNEGSRAAQGSEKHPYGVVPAKSGDAEILYDYRGRTTEQINKRDENQNQKKG